MNHADASILAVKLCPYCLLPMCVHEICINLGECPRADITQCNCYQIYAPSHRMHGQQNVGSEQARANGRKRRSAA